MRDDALRYAGFWRRFGSLLLDGLIIMPLSVLSLWADSRYRLFYVYSIPVTLAFYLFYEVYLVHRFGGTPGKLLAGIRIRKLSGEPVGYREAFLRSSPQFLITLIMSIGLALASLGMSDAEHGSLSFMNRYQRLLELAPSWYKPIETLHTIWVWGELLVMFTNRKRRALHDFIAGTVVVHASPAGPEDPTPAAG